MNTENQKELRMSANELFTRYMAMICHKDSTITYRLKSDTGEGIMRRHNVANGIELIYAEIESYSPMYQEEKQLVRCLEVMYMVEGHADFEMENRLCASADKGDIVIFNSRIGARECRVGRGGMRCISIVLFLDDLEDTLNNLFSTHEFDGAKMFEAARTTESCVCFPANDMLESIFTGLLQVPEKYADYHRKLLTLQAVVALMDVKDGRVAGYRYFSGDTCRKVHEARKLLGENLGTELSTEILAEKVKLNRTTLQQVFRQVYGMTVYEYRTQVRIQEAKNLLLTGKMSVTEIAGLCGYSNASKFAAVFRRVTGTVPGEWRRRMKN